MKHVPTLVTTLKQAREAQCLPTGRQHDPVKVQEHRAQRTKVNDLKKEKVSPHKLRRQTVTDSYAVSPRGLTRPSYLCVGVVPDTTACTGMHSSLISYNYDDDDDYTSTPGWLTIRWQSRQGACAAVSLEQLRGKASSRARARRGRPHDVALQPSSRPPLRRAWHGCCHPAAPAAGWHCCGCMLPPSPHLPARAAWGARCCG